jgi:hypothetical protein
LTPREGWNATLAKLSHQSGITDPDGSGHCDEASFPGEVSPDRIVEVSRSDIYSGSHVYNLHTGNNYFIASNIIVHNCNQAEELSLADWETLTTRVTGRAGNAPYAQLIGDCNPGPEHHWIRTRPQLQPLLESRHEDKPVLWDAERQEWTEQGIRTLAVLDALTGVRKERLRHGRWVSAEGAVFDFDARVHRLSVARLKGMGVLC